MLRNIRLILVLALSLMVASCDTPSREPSRAAFTQRRPLLFVSMQNSNLWSRMASNFTMNTNPNNVRVKRYIKFYTNEEAYDLVKFSERATPYLYHILELLDEYNLPHELALLPIVESEYRPQATSKVGAAGLWQLAAATGRPYGLKQDAYFDGRRDVDGATRAALGHLQYLYEKFDRDWLLALAAYNCGEAKIMSAMRHNKRLGKPTDYWSLSLPAETLHFVPKFLALVYLVQNAPALNIPLAKIPDQPYFAKVTLKSPIEIKQAAALAGVDVTEIKKLNPGLRANSTPPKGPHHLLLPVDNVAQFETNYQLALQKKQTAPKSPTTHANGKVHTVVKGDTLIRIATLNKTTVKSIKSKNNLKSDIIVLGQKLAV